MKLKNIPIFTVILLLITFFTFRIANYFVKRGSLPKVAIILDDWGYNLNNIDLLRLVDVPISLAVLPSLKYSRQVSQEAKFKNRQILLHMPMEPENTLLNLEKDTIKASMSREEIAGIFYKSLDSIDNVEGVSNHMGSKFTSDSNALSIFLELLKEKRLFFLDNISSKNSVSQNIAEDLDMKVLKRDIYLDNIDSINYVKGQIRNLVRIAKVKGYAIGTGHDRSNTIMAIKEMLPELKKQVRFVFVSDLLDKHGDTLQHKKGN